METEFSYETNSVIDQINDLQSEINTLNSIVSSQANFISTNWRLIENVSALIDSGYPAGSLLLQKKSGASWTTKNCFQ
jgi:hypothetical protein